MPSKNDIVRMLQGEQNAHAATKAQLAHVTAQRDALRAVLDGLGASAHARDFRHRDWYWYQVSGACRSDVWKRAFEVMQEIAQEERDE